MINHPGALVRHNLSDSLPVMRDGFVRLSETETRDNHYQTNAVFAINSNTAFYRPKEGISAFSQFIDHLIGIEDLAQHFQHPARVN